MPFRPLILVIYFKKTDYTTKINETEIKNLTSKNLTV